MKKFTTALVTTTMASAEKVQVEIYIESLCPDCQNITLGSVHEAFNTEGFLEMADVTYIPYGNAHEYANGDSWTFTCQHGTDECVFNEIESCGNKYIADAYQRFGFTYCVESNDVKNLGYQNVIDMCSLYLSALERRYINACWNTQEGVDLHHANALRTEVLVPAHTYVPWVVG